MFESLLVYVYHSVVHVANWNKLDFYDLTKSWKWGKKGLQATFCEWDIVEDYEGVAISLYKSEAEDEVFLNT